MIFGQRRAIAPKEPEGRPGFSDVEFMRGFLETLGQQGGTASDAGTKSTVNPQEANQRGGQGYPVQPRGGRGSDDSGRGGFGLKDVLGGGIGFLTGGWPGAALGLFAGGGAKKQKAVPQTTQSALSPDQLAMLQQNQSAFQQYISSALEGQRGLSAPYYQEQMARGQADISAQAGQQEQVLRERLASQGMYRSGSMERGLRGIQEARVAGTAGLTSQLSAQDIAMRQQSQQQAAQMYLQQMGLAYGTQTQQQQLAMQQAQLREQQQQSWMSDLAALAGLWAQKKYGQQASPGGGVPSRQIPYLETAY